MDNYIAGIRGEIIINNAKLASIEGQKDVHDSQVLFGEVKTKGRIIVLYRGGDAYYLNIIDPDTNVIVHAFDVANATGWAPRMYQRNEDTIRVMYTKNKEKVFYRDFVMSKALLNSEEEFLVAIKDNSAKYTKPQPFTLDKFMEHCFNVTGIDYRKDKYKEFASRNLLVEDTQQIQKVGDKYYLTAEVLVDKKLGGDCGGIACLMWSKDLNVWYLNNPLRMVEDYSDQTDHEISATYLNGTWHALTRYNKYTFGAPTGFRYYTSADGDNWKLHGLSPIPNAHGGIRHAIYKMKLLSSKPEGSSANKSSTEVAFILYQKIPNTSSFCEHDETSHMLRTELSLAYTTDFKTFKAVANISDRAQLHYPSMTMYQDMLYMCWSSARSGSNFISSIQWSSYNLGSVRIGN